MLPALRVAVAANDQMISNTAFALTGFIAWTLLLLVLMAVAIMTSRTDAADGLAYWFLAARIAQSVG